MLHQYFFRVFNIGMNLRAAVVLAVYRKSLTISSATRQESNTGTIVNLMSTDATRLQDVMTYLAVLWSAPLQVSQSTWEDSEPPPVPVGILRSVSLDVCVGNAACTWESQSRVRGAVGVCCSGVVCVCVL